MPPSQSDQVKYVSPNNIRDMFNKSQFPGMIEDRKLTPIYLRNAHLKAPQIKHEPYCTHSQMIRYLDQTGQWIVEIHQYLRPDKSIGGGGKPDPKRLRIGNVVFIVDIQP